jgi:pimeloyl-ACP methyl ester carboxylesterase
MIPFVEFGASGPPLFFAHANGYPPLAYRALLGDLAQHYHVRALAFSPLWPNTPPQSLRSWEPFVQQVLQWIDEQGEPNVIGVGHSLGAVSMLAAALRRPELFRAVVLLDPVMLRRRRLWPWTVLRNIGLKRLHPLIPGAQRRRRVFASTDEMFARYRRAPVFSRLDDDNLRAYIDAMARPRADGQVELAYTPEWEVAVYGAGPLNLWGQLPRLRPPLCILRGEFSDTFFPPSAARVQRLLPQSVIHTLPDTSHLLPLEQPEAVARIVIEFLSKT